MRCACLSNPIMQMGFTADTFHFLLIESYKLQCQGGYCRAGQGRQNYTLKQINIPKTEELKTEPLLRTVEWLGRERKRELSQILEQTAQGSRIQEYFRNCKNKSYVQKGLREKNQGCLGKLQGQNFKKQFNPEMKASIGKVGLITWVCLKLPALS